MEGQELIIFGIDLGTTYSCIAYVNKHGEPVVIPNSDNQATTPSVVHFEGDICIVGKEAKNSIETEPTSVVEMAKRIMGEENLPFGINGEEYTPEEISAYILRKLVQDAEQKLDRPITDVVITCPAYFGIAARDATARAGEIAGLNVRSIINEPSAAAIMYGVHTEGDQAVLVYDLGGGTFDVTVIQVKGGAITVMATGGDRTLGGRDWDEAIVRYFAEQWKSETTSPSDPLESIETSSYLLLKAEEVKQSLSKKKERSIRIEYEGRTVNVKLTRDQFNQLTARLLESTITYTKLTLEAAKTKHGLDHIDKILLVGGSTRMPQVIERLEKEFGVPCKIFDPDEAVAKGAAIYGNKLLIDEQIQIQIEKMASVLLNDVHIADLPTGTLRIAQHQVAASTGISLSLVKKFHNISVTNVASHSFGLLADSYDPVTGNSTGIISNLVIVNTQLPVKREKMYFKPTADVIQLEVIENDEISEEVADPGVGEIIGTYDWKLPPEVDLDTPLIVTFELDEQGRLHVTGLEPISQQVISLEIETRRGISPEKLRQAKERISKLSIE